MEKNELSALIGAMKPDRAAEHLRPALAQLLSGLDESSRLEFLLSLLGKPDRDKLSSMVHL